METLAQVLLVLGTAVAVILAFQRFNIPSSLGYLLVGLLLGPFTPGPAVDSAQVQALSEFGIVFLLFTIGLNFSLPQIHALRHQVLGQGTAQVALTTLLVMVMAGLAGLPWAVAFVVGAVFAQSSTTVISRQLAEEGEENSRHGRLGVAMSVFQDVTAVPFVVVIPALGAAVGAQAIATELGWALLKAVLATAVVLGAGRWLLRPFFHFVTEYRSAEVFTLTVLFISLLAGWITNHFGLSLAFGAFLAGMVLGETEFRHQVEATIRPFRDVLLGLFFIGIGMMIDPKSIPDIWHWTLLGAVVLMLVKIALVTWIVLRSGVDRLTACKTGLLLAVGGEFGFAILAIAANAGVVSGLISQMLLGSVLLSIIIAPFLIRYNGPIAAFLTRYRESADDGQGLRPSPELTSELQDHVIICGYGRTGQVVGNVLEDEGIPHIALDVDPGIVRQARLAGEPCFFGDIGEHDMLELIGIDRARLVVISHEDTAAAVRGLRAIRALRPHVPVMVRTRDLSHVDELRAAGATEVVPETLEAGLMIASQTLVLLGMPLGQVARRAQARRAGFYRIARQLFHSAVLDSNGGSERLQPMVVPPESRFIGVPLAALPLEGVSISALVRQGDRRIDPDPSTELAGDDVLVLFGEGDRLETVVRTLQS